MAWLKYERVMNMRSHICAVAYLLTHIVGWVTGITRVLYTYKFIEEQPDWVNVELTEMIMPIIIQVQNSVCLMILVVFIISFKKPRVCQAYYYLFLLYFVLKEAMPADYGQFWNNSCNKDLCLIFVMYSNGNYYTELFTALHTQIFVNFGLRYIMYTS